MKSQPLPTAALADLFSDLDESGRDAAQSLHALGESLGCGVAARQAAQCRRVTYSLKKPRRSLFTLEICGKSLRVKANLFHIDAYREVAENCCPAIKEAIKASPPCTGCNARCAGHPFYQLDGARYRPCYGNGHFFSGLRASQWAELRTLITLESRALRD